jgi:hypothetical protein
VTGDVDKHPPVACMSDAANCEADAIVDGQQRVLGRGNPRRSQAGDVFLLAGVVYLVSAAYDHLPSCGWGLEATNNLTFRNFALHLSQVLCQND